jgi:hypothetical protein
MLRFPDKLLEFSTSRNNQQSIVSIAAPTSCTLSPDSSIKDGRAGSKRFASAVDSPTVSSRWFILS